MKPPCSRQSFSNPLLHHAGLTLIELLVVLSIVAVLSTVALRSVVGVLDEKNYDANVLQMEEVEKAIIGDGDTVGFLGDIGRLPIAVGDASENNLSQLAELWDRSVTRAVPANSAQPLPEYAINVPTGDIEVRLGTGWRGPYLNLGINRNDLTDGFANRLFLLEADGVTEADDEGGFATIQSRGANRELNGPGIYDEDLEVIVDENSRQTDVTVIVRRQPGGDDIKVADAANLIVRAYGADGAGGLHTVDEKKVILTADTSSQPFTFSDLPHGAKVLRAYQDTTDPTDEQTLIETDPPPVHPATTPHERKSPATYVIIDRFTNTITLTLY